MRRRMKIKKSKKAKVQMGDRLVRYNKIGARRGGEVRTENNPEKKGEYLTSLFTEVCQENKKVDIERRKKLGVKGRYMRRTKSGVVLRIQFHVLSE